MANAELHPASTVAPLVLEIIRTLAYEQLKAIAARVKRRDPFASLTTTELVNETWLKLSASAGATVSSEAHLRALLVHAMRQVLVDSARRRRAIKRAGLPVSLDESLVSPVAFDEEILAIDTALERLQELNHRQARIVDAHFFGGLSFVETANLLGVSEATVFREWRSARAWLELQLK